jgi:hypothetical protein
MQRRAVAPSICCPSLSVLLQLSGCSEICRGSHGRHLVHCRQDRPQSRTRGSVPAGSARRRPGCTGGGPFLSSGILRVLAWRATGPQVRSPALPVRGRTPQKSHQGRLGLPCSSLPRQGGPGCQGPGPRSRFRARPMPQGRGPRRRQGGRLRAAPAPGLLHPASAVRPRAGAPRHWPAISVMSAAGHWHSPGHSPPGKHRGRSGWVMTELSGRQRPLREPGRSFASSKALLQGARGTTPTYLSGPPPSPPLTVSGVSGRTARPHSVAPQWILCARLPQWAGCQISRKIRAPGRACLASPTVPPGRGTC